PLTAAALEMMNLTGDGNGYDMLVMSSALREKVPTSNFFQRGGDERNPVAARNNTVAKLIAATDAKMVQESKLPGAKDLAAAFDEVASREGPYERCQLELPSREKERAPSRRMRVGVMCRAQDMQGRIARRQ